MATKIKTIKTDFYQKHGVESDWNKAVNFTPASGQIIVYDPDENFSYPRMKIGDGVTKIVDLPFTNAGNTKAVSNYSSASGTFYESEGNQYPTIAGQRGFEIINYSISDDSTLLYVECDNWKGIDVGDTVTLLLAKNYLDYTTISELLDDYAAIRIPISLDDSMFAVNSSSELEGNYLCIRSKPQSGQIDIGVSASAKGFGNHAVGMGSSVEGCYTFTC